MRTLLVWTVLACVGFAQEAPPPAKELARYDRLIGTWEGSGVVNMPMAEGVPWTSRTYARHVLGGHFVRADTRIDVQGEMPGTLGFITFYGWDRERQRHVYYEVSNMGMLMEGEILWPDEDTMMTISASTNQGAPKVERWITTLKEGQHDFVGEEASGTGPWGLHVRGSSKKLERDAPVDLTELGAFHVQQTPEMQAAQRMAGDYHVEGSFRMRPGEEAIEFEGEEIARPRFGGTVLEFEVSGQPGDWEGWSALVHDHVLGHYRTVSLDNMGMGGVSDAWRTDEGWLFTMSGLMYGQPFVSRMTLRTDEAGRMKQAVAHSILGAAEPYESFRATYTPAPTAGTRPAGAERDSDD